MLGIEQFARLHPYGSYAGKSRLFRMALKEGPEYIELVKRSRELYLRLNELSGRDVFLSIGALSIGPKELENMKMTEQVISEFSLESKTDDDYSIYDPLGGGIRPELAVFTTQEQALANGADFVDTRRSPASASLTKTSRSSPTPPPSTPRKSSTPPGPGLRSCFPSLPTAPASSVSS